jgi:hypothetical protein
LVSSLTAIEELGTLEYVTGGFIGDALADEADALGLPIGDFTGDALEDEMGDLPLWAFKL